MTRVSVEGVQLLVTLLAIWLPEIPVSAYYGPKGYGSGCQDGTTEGFQDERHQKIAACEGHWEGHIENATASLCAKGWRVCGWYDADLLKTINWKDATGLSGCYALNAAQDGGRCRPCISHMEQDDLAGVGRGCPHQSYGQKSCITGGQIDVSCCVDTHFHRACTYRPGLATGALCCRLPGIPPQILVRPESFTHMTTGVTFVLSCQAMGSPTPTVSWYRAGEPIPKDIPRISTFDSGYMLISQAEPEDSGDYQCRVSNIAGDDTVDVKIVVTDHPSGCADGNTDALYNYEGIQACKGRWQGHVKRGKSLCAKGWHVCNPRDTPVLKMLTWADIMALDDCYAYNAANALNRCSRCHRGELAGVGGTCGRIRRNHKSCLAQGRIDVFKKRPQRLDDCSYEEGRMAGVLCCKKQKKKDLPSWYKPPSCKPRCANGGVCTEFNRCKCPIGYKGAWCQNPICQGGCIPNSVCVKPGVCRCKSGYTGHKCQKRPSVCRPGCQHGGRCHRGTCKCTALYRGNSCQYSVRWRPPSELNRTEK